MLKRCPCYDGMEENGTIGDFSRSKLTKVPELVLNRGRHLEELYLDSNNIELLPKGVFQLSKLRVLSVSDNNVCKLPGFIGNLVSLEKLDVSKNCISSFPDNIVRCTDLAQVDASVNPIVKLSEGLMCLTNLTHLVLNETYLESLPENFGRLSRLKVLEIRHNNLQSLPKSMYNLKELERLDIGDNKFINLPVAIGYLANLQELLADCNLIEEIPPVIGLLRNLTFLELSKNKLECLPPEVEALYNLTDLHLSVNELLELPENIGSLSCLQTLKLDENDLIFLPPSIGSLENLEELDVTANNLEFPRYNDSKLKPRYQGEWEPGTFLLHGLPPSIGLLKKLRILTLDNNCIKSIPDELGNCTSLSLLSLHSNELIAVPETIGYLQNLQMINISANMLTSLPLSFLGLKNLRALWLSENQSKPVVPLQKKYNEKSKKYVVGCYLLPQEFCELDETEDGEKVDESSPPPEDNENISIEEDVDSNDCKESEVLRTRGSISQTLISGNNQNRETVEDEAKPWYEQEFIENEDDVDVFLGQDEVEDKGLSADENRSLGQANNISLQESFQSRYSFKEEQPSSLTELVNMIPSTLKVSSTNDESLESTGIIEHAFMNSPSSSLFSSCLTSSAEAGAVRGLGEHIDSKSLAETSAEPGDDSVYGNTSAISASSPVHQYCENVNSTADPSYTLSTSDEENMRLRFSNKRNRNGNPLCQYEAFKPTRFNLYQDVSWGTLDKDPLDASSPIIKKKSVTSKGNPLIGERLARDESPQRVGQHNQKYEEKIRALQQQRLKERSRRRSNSARVEYHSELQDAAMNVSEAPLSPGNEQSNGVKLATHHRPPHYVISDNNDTVAIKLTDFTLSSLQPANEVGMGQGELAEAAVGRQQDESSAPVEFNRFNGLTEQQRHNASHYKSKERPASPENILHATALHNEGKESGLVGRALAVSSRRAPEERGYRQADDINCNNDRDVNQSGWREEIGASFGEQRGQRETDQGNYLNFSQVAAQDRGRDYRVKVVSPQSDFSSDTSSGVKKTHHLSPNTTVQHVTVKSTEINRPLSPRLVMTSDGRSEKQDITFKEFRSNCNVEDVASFLVSNIKDDVPMISVKDTPVASQIIQEQVAVDCDIEEVTRNISKHLVEFCKVENDGMNGKKQSEVKVRVTDLDMPDAACPLSRNTRHKLDGNAKSGEQKQYQVITISDGPRKEIQLRVYRSPILGFTIGGGVENEGKGTEGIYVVSVKPEGPSAHLLQPGDRILEVNKLNLRDVSHEHAVLFLTHNQQLDLLIEREVQE